MISRKCIVLFGCSTFLIVNYLRLGLSKFPDMNNHLKEQRTYVNSIFVGKINSITLFIRLNKVVYLV